MRNLSSTAKGRGFKKLDLELLLDRISRIFKSIEEGTQSRGSKPRKSLAFDDLRPPSRGRPQQFTPQRKARDMIAASQDNGEYDADSMEEEFLQAALIAQVRQKEYRGMQGKNWVGPKSSQDPRPERHGVDSESGLKLTKLILDLKAEIQSWGIAQGNDEPLHQYRISSYDNKHKEQSAIVTQRDRFAGIAKQRNQSIRSAQHDSLVQSPNRASDSNDEPQEQAYSVIMVKWKPKTSSPRSMNEMLVGYTRHNHKDAP
jgi:hypothetical protein